MTHIAVISDGCALLFVSAGVISCFGNVPWPPHLPDPTTPDFILRGYLKSKQETLCRLKYTQTSHMR
jgi:hypothetical protein